MRATYKAFQPRGFTLTELMVVIVIVVVLATIGFIGANRAKESATKATCSSNLRQIGLGLAAHQADFRRYPGKNDGQTWDRAIIPYLGYEGPKDLKGSGPLTKEKWPELDRVAELFACASDRYERSGKNYARSYAIVPWTTNWSNGTSFRGWKDRPFNTGVPMSIVRRPANAAVVVEWHSGNEGIENVLGAGSHAYHDLGGPTGSDRDVHRQNQIVLFADGHTEVLPMMSSQDFIKKYWAGSIGSTN
ncbi:DUF1559 domain-containing protein [Haloferula sp.]|uniref:DUF1559 family PulG-like putative transporter n=1 Tax=Haloferula sp. TaxID=2497595 RepID=UPI00329CAA47